MSGAPASTAARPQLKGDLRREGIRLRDRIAFRQASYVVLLGMALGLFLSLLQIVEDFFSDRAGTEESIDQILTSVEQPAAQAAFLLDRMLARDVAHGLMSYGAVASVVLRSDFDEPLTEVTRDSTAPTSWLTRLLFDDSLTIERPLFADMAQPALVGTLVVTVNPQVYGEAFIARAVRTTIYGFIRNVLIALLVFAIFYRTLTRPLLNLAGNIARINPTRPGAAVRIPPGHERDEIGMLATSANQLLRDVSDSQEALQASRADAIRERLRAEQANRAKTRFLATMSHELRTPLNAILGFSEMIRDEMLGRHTNSRYKEYAADIHSSGSHLLHLINEILDISKIEAGKMELAPSPIELATLLSTTVRTVQPRAQDMGLQITLQTDGELPRLMADEQAMRQVIYNLLSNAVKFTPAGGSITVGATVKGECMEISVADTGVGIKPEQLARVFRPFEQADNRYSARKDVAAGTGLGLALVQKLVEMHGGQVRISSTVDVGTTVTVVMPLAGRTDGNNPGHETGITAELTKRPTSRQVRAAA